MITHISVIKSINTLKNYHKFAFRTHQYATIRGSLIFWNIEHELCMNSGTFIFLIDRKFIANQTPHAIKHVISSNIKIRNIDSKIHDSSEYVILDFYFKEKCHKETAVTHVKTEFHFVDELKIKILININVMNSKQMSFNFDSNILMISICQNMKISISFHRKANFVDKTMKATSQMIILIGKIMTVSMRMRGDISKNRDYNFYFKVIWMLKTENEFFVHVTDSELMAVQIKNVFRKLFIVFKNFKMRQLRNYDEKNCFMTNSENCHLAITSVKFINVKKTLTKKNDIFKWHNNLWK